MAIRPLKIKAKQSRQAKGKPDSRNNYLLGYLTTFGSCTIPQKTVVKSSNPWCIKGLKKKKPRQKMFYFLPCCFLLFGGGLFGCADSNLLGIGGMKIGNLSVNVTTVSEIQENQKADGIIYLEGQVANQAPFLAAGAYELQDPTGSIWVITNRTLPKIDDEILIQGQLKFQSIPLAGQDLGEVYIQEQQRIEHKIKKTEP